jgi:glycosyltransferase 2 family protein
MVLLLWLSLRGIQVGDGENKSTFLWHAWEKSNKTYLLLMAVTVTISNIIRAERWRMLLRPTQHHISFSGSFLSLLIGYLVNLAVPRGGEVSRCYNLYKLEKTPVEVSFGTVVVERIIDVICLMAVIALSFLMEWKKLKAFIDTLELPAGSGSFLSPWKIFIVLGLLAFAIGIYFLRKNEKFRKIINGFKGGLLAIFQLKNRSLFIFYSISIWALYFLMSYFVLKAFTETQHLGVSAVMTLFAIGAIAMAVPLPGGAGSYHTLVPMGLVALYQLPKTDAIAFVFIFHGWQTLIMIIGGVVSLMISYWMIRWKKVHEK